MDGDYNVVKNECKHYHTLLLVDKTEKPCSQIRCKYYQHNKQKYVFVLGLVHFDGCHHRKEANIIVTKT